MNLSESRVNQASGATVLEALRRISSTPRVMLIAILYRNCLFSDIPWKSRMVRQARLAQTFSIFYIP